jgi:hypothetical protein
MSKRQVVRLVRRIRHTQAPAVARRLERAVMCLVAAESALEVARGHLVAVRTLRRRTRTAA